MNSNPPPYCNVCAECIATAGGLCCGHVFCPECFDRYIAGSIRELNTSGRCCICGQISDLIEEISGDAASVTYGREGQTKLGFPVGITRHQNGHIVTVDIQNKRVNVHDATGLNIHDFAYTYSTTPTGGATVTPRGEIAIPCINGNHACVSYFTTKGSLQMTSYVMTSGACGSAPNIRGVACDLAADILYLTDENNACIHVIDNKTRQQCALLRLKPIQFETTPIPAGIVVTKNGDVIFTDTANHCVKVYGKDGSFLRKIGTHGNRPGQFDNPTDVIMTSRGELVIADRGNQRVQLLSNHGEFRRYVVRFKSGMDVYMAPSLLAISEHDDEIIVLMTSLQTASVGEVRLYKV